MQDISKSSIANKHDDIPIAIDTEAVMKLWLSEVYMNNLPKTIRFTIYMKILELLADMLSYAYAARFNKEERKVHLDKYLHSLKCVEAYTRVIHESGFLPDRRCQHLTERYNKMSKQAVTWRNYTR
jgi:hypothetical protein